MAPTSGTVSHNPVFNTVVYAALRKVNAYNSGGSPRAEQVADAVAELNDMLKEWQSEGLTWLRQFIYVTLVAAQASYDIGPTSVDLVHADTASATDYLQRPVRVHGATRLDTDGNEVPLNPVSRGDYLAKTSKSSAGTVVDYYYDAQRDNGVLFVWPTPATGVTDKIVLDVDRIIEDAGTDGTTETLDIPPDWINAVKWGLAARICPEYGVPLSERDRLGKEAEFFKDKATGFARENVSTFFQPG
jgi:hypothetical protein